LKTQTKTEEQLITELVEMRQRIAELEKANTEHKQVEELFKSLTSSSPIGIYVVQDGKFQFVNAQFQKYAGYSEDELLGMDSLNFVFPDDRNRVRENAVKMLKGERSIPYEYQFVNKEGEVRWIMETVVPIQYLGRRAALGNFMDITERKQAEEALRESEEKYRTVLEDIEDGYFEVDIAGNFTFFNDPLCGIIGYSRDEMMGMNNRQYMDKENAKKIYQTFNRVYTTGKTSKEFGWGITRKDGTKRFTEASVSLKRNSEGEPIGFQGIVRDITERKRTEEELRKYREHLEELVAARTKELQDAQERLVRTEKLAVIGQLAGGVSHELRNPLGAIKNASYFLNMAIEQPEPEVKETLEILQKEVATSERIISSLLDFARPKTATLQNVHINEVIEESLGRVTVPENVEVVRHFDETLPIILADPGQLGQVFTNIILNAIQAMPEGGQLVLKSAVPSRGWAAVSFTDTGAGISEENLEKLFEPLFTTKAKGIGLGLAICRTMVEAHGGTIEVQSTEGKGSTFTISLPVGKKEEH